jgi:hypothetical protein
MISAFSVTFFLRTLFLFYFIYMHLSRVNGMLNVLYSGQKDYCYVGTPAIYVCHFVDLERVQSIFFFFL